MSQEKVDKYKKDKANRKKLMAQQKRQEFLEKSVFALIGVALVAFVVVSAYFKWFHKEKKTVAEAATYSLSEEEISSVWQVAENPTEQATTAPDDSTEKPSEEDTTAAPEEKENEKSEEDADQEEQKNDENSEDKEDQDSEDNEDSDDEDNDDNDNEDNDDEE